MADKTKAAEAGAANDARAAEKPAKKKKAAEAGAVTDAPAAGKPAKKAKPAPAEAAAEAAPKPHTVSTKVPKLAKKNKSRLPRRQKKALAKLQNAKRA